MSAGSPNIQTRSSGGRSLLYLGILAALVGVGIFAVQFNAAILKTPWYMPILATLGVGMIYLSLKRQRTVARWIAAGLFTLFAGFQWFAMLVMMKLPAYTGPAKIGQELPAFAAAYSDGSPFNQDHLKNDKNTILLFFRGRW